jgi:glucosamine-6-phosphate deaminase
VQEALASKKPGDADSDEVLDVKELIRWSEAKAGALVCGCREEHLHFLDLPFYKTGTIDKRPPGPKDVEKVRRTIEEIQPDQVYVAGDLSDPHGTHRVCAQVIFKALGQIEAAGGPRPGVLLYRGAWQEWPLHVIDIAVPLSPPDLDQKKAAIFRHESQKDSALFPGPDDPREFWQRAEDRNRHTADAYNQIGLPEYYAMEAFVRWDGKAI